MIEKTENETQMKFQKSQSMDEIVCADVAEVFHLRYLAY